MPSSAKRPTTLKAFETLMGQLNCRIVLGGDWVDGITDVFNEDNKTYARLIFDCEFKLEADASDSYWKFGVSIVPATNKLGNPKTPKEIAEYLQSYLRIAAVFLTTDEPLMVERKKEAHPRRAAKPTTP
jgi:hypothetical protein